MPEKLIDKSVSTPWTIIKLLRWAAAYLKTHDIDSPRATGEVLLAHALKRERIDLYLHYDQPLVGDELQAFKSLIKRRIRREPVAYILGTKEFCSMELGVTADVLIPRPETECLVEAALALLSKRSSSKPTRILDLGTGSGAIVLALASQQPQNAYFASDFSIRAIEVAAGNARRHDLDETIQFMVADWLDSLNPEMSEFDMIASNPPYIPSGVLKELQPEIHCYEPTAALDGEKDGLACFRKIINSAYRYLKPGGVLMLDIGHDQQDDVRGLVYDSGHYDDFCCTKDYAGYDRVVWMHKSE
jgi:release factor glutamine methyltransferase